MRPIFFYFATHAHTPPTHARARTHTRLYMCVCVCVWAECLISLTDIITCLICRCTTHQIFLWQEQPGIANLSLILQLFSI